MVGTPKKQKITTTPPPQFFFTCDVDRRFGGVVRGFRNLIRVLTFKKLTLNRMFSIMGFQAHMTRRLPSRKAETGPAVLQHCITLALVQKARLDGVGKTRPLAHFYPHGLCTSGEHFVCHNMAEPGSIRHRSIRCRLHLVVPDA